MRQLVAGLTAIMVATTASAQKVLPEKAFGKRAEVLHVSLSPNGDRVAYIAATGARGMTLYVFDLTGDAVPRAVVTASGAPEQIDQCNWVSDTRLICMAYETKRDADRIVSVSKLFAVNADGTNMKRVTIRQGKNAQYAMAFGGNVIDMLPGDDGAVLVGRQYVPESNINTRIEKKEEGYGVDRIDTATLTTKRVVRPYFNASEYISDGIGNVRIMGATGYEAGGYAQTKTTYSYRVAGKDQWQPLSEYSWITEQGFNPLAVEPKENAAYGFDRQDGRQALFKVALDGSLKRTLVFGRPDVDVDGLERLGRQQRIIGVSYATEKRTVEYFDPVVLKLSSNLRKALPKTEFIGFAGASTDENKMIIWAGSDVDPGQYYHLNRKTNQMSALFPERPELADYRLAEVKPITYRTADGTTVPAYLTLPPGSSGKNLPAIVMPHGGPSARDEWGFDWWPQYYAHKGYAVLQPNYRGSSGYGDAWFRNMGFKAWDVAIGDVVDAGRWLVSQGIADPAKLAVVGWSYGGYAALQSGVVAPALYKAIVAVAPVTDLAALKIDSRDQWDYRATEKFIGSGPHVVAGSPAQNAARIGAPVLMFHGDLDQNVSIFQSRMMKDRLRDARKSVELVEFPGLTHSLNDSTARESMLLRSDAFLRSSMGM
jgi:dipeptidyl aminopeptidase/acylaminoacyl peptidase